MRIVLTEESHNHVDWEIRWPLLKMEIGLLVGLVVFLLIVIPSPNPARWTVVGVVTGVVILIGVLLAALSPLVDRGHLERLPEGGDLKRTKVWPLIGERVTLDAELDDIAGFEVEQALFEDAPPATYQLARLLAVTTDGERRALTVWAQPESVAQLARALERAHRRSLPPA
ncbi:MAG: hypothetical protein JXC32_10395 [Anaerolineae bacterium]|nr:hypothetical protein [Anaerolineae bacterium]